MRDLRDPPQQSTIWGLYLDPNSNCGSDWHNVEQLLGFCFKSPFPSETYIDMFTDETI